MHGRAVVVACLLTAAVPVLAPPAVKAQEPAPSPCAAGASQTSRLAPPAIDTMIGQQIAGVRLERLGQIVTDARLVGLVETKAGAPLSMREVRDSVLHLFNTGLFRDVNVTAEADGAAGVTSGLTLVYQLTPAQSVARYDFRGDLGLAASELRRVLVDRYGLRPTVARVQTAVATIEAHYRTAGYLNARVTATQESITPETLALVMTVTSGSRARIGKVDFTGTVEPSAAALQARLGVEPGKAFDGPELQRRMARLERDLRNRGYYEATVTPAIVPRDNGQVVDLALEIDRGPFVNLRVEGSAIPAARQEELVPVRREGSIDEDLLEDSKRRLEEYLRNRGHWKAAVTYDRRPTPAGFDLVFTVREGPIYRIADVQVTGEHAIGRPEIDTVLGLTHGEPFVEGDVSVKARGLTERYRRQGFRLIKIDPSFVEHDTPQRKNGGREPSRSNGRDDARGGARDHDTAWVAVRLSIVEGPQTRVGTITLEGNHPADETSLRMALGLKPSEPFYEPQIAGDREAIQLFYLNRGFERVQVEASTFYSADATRADVIFTIHQGTQLFVDRVLIIGNTRTASETIEKVLTIRPGAPLGLSDLFESQRRVSALGLFRRVRITDVGEPGESLRDVIVSVEEAPMTAVGYGVGIEAGRRAGFAEDGTATEKLDVAARGFFEVSRRNLFGTNRSVTLFTRGTVRPRDEIDTLDTSIGFNEYRVLGTLRDPALFGTTIDAQGSGYFEQAIRSSFNFRRRGLQADLTRRVRNRLVLVGTYSFTQTELFDERISDEERPDIDRLFPEVRLSVLSAAMRRDTRDDVLDPTRGTVVGLENDVAIRALGSEVGFIKGFGEMFWYKQLPSSRSLVFATGVRIGLAKGFSREVPREIDGIAVVGPDGEPLVDRITDLPASERFFAGGDTTVRGYARDTLGDQSTIVRGFPRGGNAVIILNSELRTPVWRDFGSGFFFDVGNVFSRVSEIDLAHLRPTAGFGIRYKSPIGPIRVDLGFKLDRGRFDREPGDPFYHREPLTEFHISIGQAF
jgi:outer membrane protein insertion porin family